MKILAAGDHFVLNSLICDALEAAVTASPFELTELTLPWPLEPFGRVAEVDEAGDCEDALIEALRDVEVCVTQMAPFTERVLEASPALRLVAVCRGGPVNVNVEAARARGVRVCFAPGRNAAATAEFTVAMMLAADAPPPAGARLAGPAGRLGRLVLHVRTLRLRTGGHAGRADRLRRGRQPGRAGAERVRCGGGGVRPVRAR